MNMFFLLFYKVVRELLFFFNDFLLRSSHDVNTIIGVIQFGMYELELLVTHVKTRVTLSAKNAYHHITLLVKLITKVKKILN